VECDLANPAAVKNSLAEIRAALGTAPDILVNNAGTFFLAPIERTSVDEFERTIQTNLTSHFSFIREFLPELRHRGSGHVVTIGSMADRRAYPENAAYAASKYGARGLHEVLREELRGSGVRATLVSPSPVDTSLWDDVNPDERAGFTPRAQMLAAAAVADAVRYVVTRPDDVNVDELRLSHS
jgi:NADP-dependent 3-hydroxy acid dehydrogenase YdfG